MFTATFPRKRLDLSKGFTLVELLVVIAIIGVLATLVLLQLGTARAKSRDAKRISDISQLRSAIELFYDDNTASYPAAINSANLGKYMASGTVPVDPSTGGAYNYAYDQITVGGVNKQFAFHLYIQLEAKNTAALAADADIDSSSGWTLAGMNASNPVNSEACTAAYAGGSANDCIYDVGQDN